MTIKFFSKQAPCANCPFKIGAFDGLHPERRKEIAESILHKDHSFTCHKHITGERDEDEDGERTYTPGADDIQCAGALILMKNTYRNGDPDQNALKDNRITRMGLIFGWLDPDKLIDTGVYPTVEEFIKGE